jgi:polar amino acid transport system substrate-binding protein
MKRSVLSIVLVIAAMACPTLRAEVVRVAYSDLELVPYQMGTGVEIPNPPGAMLDLLKQAGTDLGFELAFERSPQLRNLKRLQNGEVDATFMLSFEPARLQHGVFPMKDGQPDVASRLVQQSYVFYRLKASPFQWNGHVVSGLVDGKVGFNHGFSIGAVLGEKGIKTEYAKTTEQNFKKLALRRISAYAMQEHAADHYLAHHPMPEVEKLPIPLETKSYYLVFSKQFVARNPALAHKMWAHIARLREEKLPSWIGKYTAP